MAAMLAVQLCAAGRVFAEPLLVTLEGHAALPLTAPQSQLFGPGGSLGLAVHYPLAPAFLVGVRLRAGLLLNGDPPTQPGVEDPGFGSFQLLGLNLRLRPFASGRDVRRAPGFFVDAGGGGGLTGKKARPSVEAGIGYGFALGAVTLAPSVRYVQVIQPSDVLSGNDARLLLAGLELTFNDAEPPAPPKPQPKPKAEPSDRDHDGILDNVDKCPDAAEDFDGYQDLDGCPEPDNDDDGILDKQDACPVDPEDRDGFEDDDGCPEPDNDSDGILDGADKCPNEPEVVNGNDDEDGCPDEGEIVLEHGRIVLEEQVLFDYQYARVKHRARPVLAAIAKLIGQHPEWVAVHIEGHADMRGPNWANQMLSEQRADNVMSYLVSLGVPADKLTATGYGKTRLRDTGDTEEAHQRNRRVEFVIETVAQRAASEAAAGKHAPPSAAAPDKRAPLEKTAPAARATKPAAPATKSAAPADKPAPASTRDKPATPAAAEPTGKSSAAAAKPSSVPSAATPAASAPAAPADKPAPAPSTAKPAAPAGKSGLAPAGKSGLTPAQPAASEEAR